MGPRERIGYVVKAAQRRLFSLPDKLALITGCPRSGTTALVRWLDSNRRVYAISESRAMHAVNALVNEARRHKKLNRRRDIITDTSIYMLSQYYYSTRFMLFPDIIIDKEPLLGMSLGKDKDPARFIDNVRYVIPELKVVVLVRDPVSTLWSMTQRKWGHSIEGRDPRFIPLNDHIKVWNDSSRLILDLRGDKNFYVCQFERLCNDPEHESKRIFDFLNINGNKIFSPRPTKTTGFNPEEIDQIHAETGELARALAEGGIIDSSLWHRV